MVTDCDQRSVVVFDSHEKCESMLSVLGGPAGRLSVCGKNFHVVSFLDSVNMKMSNFA